MPWLRAAACSHSAGRAMFETWSSSRSPVRKFAPAAEPPTVKLPPIAGTVVGWLPASTPSIHSVSLPAPIVSAT